MAKIDLDNAFALAGDREIADIPKEYAQGANTFLSSVLGSLDDSIVGDVLRAVKGKPFRKQVEVILAHPDISQEEKNRIANEYLNADTILQQGQEALKGYSNYWAKQKSKKTQALDRYVGEAEGDTEIERFANTIGRYAENPATIGLQTIGQLPQLLPVAGLATGLRTKAGQALLQKTGIGSANAGTALGALLYQSNVGGQQAREQSLEDSAENMPLGSELQKSFDNENYKIDPSKIDTNEGQANRYNAARIATDKASKISAAAGLIGLKSDLALTNLLMGESIKGLSKKGLKAAAGHLAKNIAEETIDEAGSPIGANIGAQQTYDPKRDTFENVGRQAAAGAILGAGMGSVQSGSLYLFGDGDKNTKQQTGNPLVDDFIRATPRSDIPKQHEKTYNAFNAAQEAKAQAQSAYEADPTPENETILAEATDAAMQAQGEFNVAEAAFKQSFTPEEQENLLSPTMKGVAARAKLAQEAEAQRQAELAEQQKAQAEIAKAQRENLVKGLSAFVGNEAVLLNEIDQLGLDDAQSEQLLKEVYQFKQPSSKQAKSNKTPLEKAVDAHFDAKGNRDPKVMSQDVADKYKLPLKEVLRGVLERTRSQEKAKQDEVTIKNQKLTEQQQLDNTLADFASQNDTDSMLSLLDGYDQAEANKLMDKAYKTVESRKTAEEKAKTAEVKQVAAKQQRQSKEQSLSADMRELRSKQPNAGIAEWKALGKKHGITDTYSLAKAWASAAQKEDATENSTPKEPLRLNPPESVMVADAQGNVTPTTQSKIPKKPSGNDVVVPSGLKVDASNLENKQRDSKGAYIGSATAPVVNAKQPKKPDDDQDGGVVEQPKPNKPVLPNSQNATNEANTTGEQIAQAMDKTAQAIAEKAHSKVIERVKSGEEIVYKQSAAIERVKQDDRYQVEINNEGHAVVKNVKDANGEWVKKDEPIVTKEIKQSKPVSRQINPDRDNILTAIAKAGGLKRSEAIARKAIDRAYFGKKGAGLLPVFRANEDEGLSLDAMAEILSGYGYPVHEGGNSPYDSTNGSYSPNALEDALIEALNGKDIGTFEYEQRKAQEHYDAQMKEAEELERLFNSKGSSTWDDADALDIVVTTTEQELIKGESTVDINVLSETLKEVENVTDTRISGQNNDSTTKAQGTKTSIAEAIEEGKAGQQKSEGGTRQNTGLQGLTLTSQTEASRKQEEDAIKAAEVKRLAEEKAAKDKAQADKELNDFRLTGSNTPADIAMAGGQKDMFAAPTRGEREAEKAKSKINDVVENAKQQETIIEHTTKKGSVIRGVVRTGITKQEAQKIDPYTFAKDGGWFIREKYLGQENKANEDTTQDKSVQNNETEKPREDVFIGKSSEGKDLYEDSRGVRYYKQGGAKVYEGVALGRGNALGEIQRTDEYRTAEEVAARQPKEEAPSNKTKDDNLEHLAHDDWRGNIVKTRAYARILIDNGKLDKTKAGEAWTRHEDLLKLIDEATTPKKKAESQFANNKIVSAEMAEAAIARIKAKMNRLNSGFDPELFTDGVIVAVAYIESGVHKFGEFAKTMIDGMGDNIKPYLLSFWEGARSYPNLNTEGMTDTVESKRLFDELNATNGKDDDVIDFDFATLNESSQTQDTQNVTTPSQTSRDNVGERVKTPESSQVQRASEPRPAQANTQERDDGVSANSGGRRDRGNLSNESGKSKARSQESDVASTRSQSSKLADSTRSPESSDGENLRNYRIQPNELKRVGSWKATAEQNVQIVELVKTIITENRAATPEEKALLTKFTGWGASEIANGIFPNQYGSYKDASWEALGKRLEAALSPEEYAQAKRTTQYAHYTSEPIIRSVYAALSRFGFNGGSMVEPGMGVGLFNGLMPDAMANNSQYTGIEYDTITGNIAKLLYPDSNIIVGDYTQTKLPKNFFDVAIGNPPFGSIKIQSDPEYKKQGFLLHDYFFAKTIDRVKEGGLLVFVTSKGTMDKTSDRARTYLADRADLVGAIRLPQTAFKDNAGTEVVTDVIFLRKRMAGQEPAGEAWAGLKEITTPQGKASINEYFATHPEMILGKSALTSSMYRANEYTVEPIAGTDIETLFSEAINNLPENIYTPQQGSKAEQAAVQRRDYDPKIKKEGGIYVADDGVLMQVNNGQGTPLTQKQNSKNELVDLSPKEKEWLKDYVGVRDALKQAQYDQLQDNANWQQSLDTLNKTYDAFVKKHGFMLEHSVSERENEDGSTTVTKRFKNKSIMGLDAESALINALEQINGDNSISKAPALLGRVINKPSTPVITSTQDAMFVVFNELGRFDLAKVAKLINKSEKDVITELGDSIYEDPSSSWTTADDYLSGNVVRKLKEAEQAARLNPKYQRNVTALKAVQPPALAPQDINVQLGAAWIPASDIGLFASEVLGEQRLKVGYSPLTGQWSVEGTANYSSEWGIPAKDSKDILEAVLNNRQIKVTYTDENKKTHTDTEKTEKANDIAKKMRQSFKKWLWEDVPRTERLVTYYNEHFNNIAPRSFDGQHLTLPGVSSRFDLRPHQKRAIWRTIQQGDVYYAHAVGAGKTFTMIASGMEERRLGLVKKPMYVVPNHMLAQFSKEFLELYPMANIMVADEQNFHTHNRRKFVAQAALNNPDAIVITHSAFGRIGMSSDYSAKFINNQIADWQEALQEVGNDERITRKQIERRIEQLENKLKALLDGAKDQLLTFEELGVDRLYVDEGHEFRKLDFPTNRGNIKGIDPSGSQKSMDLYMKVEYLRSKNPNRALVMASGTPVTNTMGELFTVQRFFNPSQLEEDGDSRFDAWSAHYGEVVDGLEQNAAGGYETVSRFAKFVNVPELMSRVRYFMDILTSNQLGDLVQRPDVVGGGRQVIVTPAPDGYKEYQKDLERRIKAIRDRKAPPKAGDDIILSVIGDGRFSAIDMRFVDSTLPSDPNSKLNRMLDDLISAYHETANNEYVTSGVIDPNKGSSLMLFTDIGLGEQSAKNRGFDMKAWIEKRLVEGGVKREHIAFMRDNKAHSKKEKLFDDMRQGRKRILIGGKDMETGVNAQKRLTHLFHLDAPWFPASVEQREGRIIRQGNQNKIVAIRAYASKGSYDSTMWGMNSRKARFIEQAMSGDSSVRSMEDVSEASAFEMAAALASGDERYLKLAGLKGDVERLGRLYSAHIDEQKRFAREKSYLESSNKFSASKIEQINAAIAQRKPIKAGEFLANVGKKTFDNRDEFSKALFEKFKQVAESYKADEIELGSIAGFPIVYNGVELRGGNFAADLRVDLPIDVESLAIFPIDPAYSITGIATRAVNQTNALDRELISRKNAIEQNTKDLARINRRIGASFPEMAELNEKQQALNELEQELNAEGNADDDLSQTDNQDTDNKPKFSKSSTIGDRTITQVREKLISRFGKRIVEQLESKGILKIHQSMKTLPKGVLDMARGTEDAAYYNGVVHLIADNLTDETIIPTFVHELGGHKGFQEMMSPKAYELIMQQFDRLVAQGNSIAIKAKQRAERAESITDKDKEGKTDKQIKELEAIYRMRQQDEYIPYLLTEQEKAQFATPKERNAIKRLIDHIVRAVKGWVVRHLSKYDTTYKMSRRVSESLTPVDILYMAERMVGEVARYGGRDNNSRHKFSRTEQSQFDKLLAKADKMIAEQGKLLAPNGKPSKLNRYQWAQVRTDNFKAWFGDFENDPANASQVIDPETKEPMVVYHGTNKDFTQFNKLSWVAYNPSLANDYAELKSFNRGGNSQVIATFVRAINPFNADLIKKIKPSEKYPYGLSVEAFIDSIENQSKIPRGTLDNLKSIIQKGRREEESGPTYSAHNFWNDAVSMFGFEGKNAIDQAIKEAGFDSIFYTEQEVLTVGLFEPTQIKSAISNNGEFSPTNPDIRFSRNINPQDKLKQAYDYVLDSVRVANREKARTFAHAETSRWERTLGLQLSLSIKNKDFKRVYDLVQRYIQHVSSDAVNALEVAPTLMDKLDDWQDFKRYGGQLVKGVKQGINKLATGEKTDHEVVADVIFAETLANKPYTMQERNQLLKTPAQRDLYEEARAAVEISLKNTAKSEIIRQVLAAEAVNWSTIESYLNKELDFDVFVDDILGLVQTREQNFREELKQATSKKDQKRLKAEIEKLVEVQNVASKVRDRLQILLDQAYAPLMRFGEYVITVKDTSSKETVAFFMFDTKAERNRMENFLIKRYAGNPNILIETDTMNAERFKLFKGMTPETVALFAKETGMNKNAAYQEYLKLAIPSRSALTRLIKRKGIEGYSEDIQRVVTAFVMSNARYAAKNIYSAKVDDAIQDIKAGSIQEQAQKVWDNVLEPKETYARLRDMLFVWNLSGSFMFGLLNMSQPFMQTAPEFSQYIPISQTFSHIFKGQKIAMDAMVSGNAPKGYETEYRRAVREGVVDPQNTFMLSGLERGGTGATSKGWIATKHILGMIAQATESFNRKATFIAALEVAKAKNKEWASDGESKTWTQHKGFADDYSYAKYVVDTTQGVYNKGNRSNWANNPVGAPLMVFKQFSINYVEQMIRMWKNADKGEEGKKAVMLMLFMLASLAGGLGLPFIKDIIDGSETIAAAAGHPVNLEREARLLLGKDIADPLLNGWANHYIFKGVLGMDIQSRTGMGDLWPMSNIANPTLSDSQRVQEAMSLFGAAGGLGEKMFDASQLFMRGEYATGIKTALPRFASSAITGGAMLATGKAVDSKGHTIYDANWKEALVKMFDAQPVRIAEINRTRSLEFKDFAVQKYMTTEIRNKWIKAAMNDDFDTIDKLEQKIAKWNDSRPRYPILFDRRGALAAANKNELTWGERQKVPKGMNWVIDERPKFEMNK